MVVTGRSQLATSVYWTTHYVVLAAFIVFALFPLFWLLKVSVTPTKLLYTEGIRLWPSEATWANYGFVLTRSEFPRFFMNSVIVSGSTAILVTIVAAGAGYAFSRFAFRGKVIIVALMLITQMFPLVMLIAPIFKILSPLGLTNSLTGLVIVYSAFNVPFAAFLMQSFFDQIPRDLEEAAMIDGDTRLGALWRIVLPLTLPGVGATLGFVFTAAWSELLFALMLISKAGKQTFPVGLLSFVGKFSVDFGQMMAAVLLALIPVCLFFVFIQRYLVQGLTAGAVKVIRIMASVEIAGVHKSYGPVPVLHGVDLGIEDGEFIVLVGPSGCGKSTLLRMIAGLEEISAGSIRIGGAVVNDLPPRARDIAMVFQSYALYPHMNVAENMSYSLRLRRAPRDRIADTVRSAAEKLGLGQLLERRPRALSGGQRQRVAMGRAIVRKPKAFLFDEPLSNLDARLREQMRTEIKKLHRELGTTSVYVTHDQIEAMTMADRIVAMHHGIVQQIGTPPKIYDRPANIFVASFIGSPAMNLIGVVHKRTGSGSAIDIAGADFPLAKGLAVDDGAAVLAGVRPEHLRIVGAGNGRFAGRIELIEPMGLGTLIHANVAGQTLKALSFERVSLLPDMPVGIGVDADHIHLFDARTEQRLN